MSNNSRKRARKSKLEVREGMEFEDASYLYMQVNKELEEKPTDKPMIDNPAVRDISTFHQSNPLHDVASTSTVLEPKMEFSVKVEVEPCDIDDLDFGQKEKDVGRKRKRDDERVATVMSGVTTVDTSTSSVFVPSKVTVKSLTNVTEIKEFKEYVTNKQMILRLADRHIKSLNIADKFLAIQARNYAGRVPIIQKDVMFQSVLQEWNEWYHNHSGVRQAPLLYKCYVCGNSFWHLHDFKEHVPTHKKMKNYSNFKLTIETDNDECFIVYYNPSVKQNFKYPRGHCYKCQKSADSHTFARTKCKNYKCMACYVTFSTCTQLVYHEQRCMIFRNKYLTDNPTEYRQCRICEAGFYTESTLMKHLMLFHQVRSDVVISWDLHNCKACMQSYVSSDWHVCLKRSSCYGCNYCGRSMQRKVQKEVHVKSYHHPVKCRVCGKQLPAACVEPSHLLQHTEKFALLYKCSECEAGCFYPDEESIVHHTESVHKRRFERKFKYLEMVILPKQCLEVKRHNHTSPTKPPDETRKVSVMKVTSEPAITRPTEPLAPGPKHQVSSLKENLVPKPEPAIDKLKQDLTELLQPIEEPQFKMDVVVKTERLDDDSQIGSVPELKNVKVEKESESDVDVTDVNSLKSFPDIKPKAEPPDPMEPDSDEDASEVIVVENGNDVITLTSTEDSYDSDDVKSDKKPGKKKKRTREEKKRERNREYQRAWRQRQKVLKKKASKEEKEQAERKRRRDNQRAYYYRIKALREKEKREELSLKKFDDLQMNIKKLDNNEDQETVGQCTASQNFEIVKIENQLSQPLGIYEESHECITPNIILHRHTDIPSDGNCLFHSAIRVLKLQISTCDLRQQLRDSPYLNSCHDPRAVNKILSSNDEYGDLDCLCLVAKTYDQNICLHYLYINVHSSNAETRFYRLKVNDTNNWCHLDLRALYFTPYTSADEKMREEERKQKKKNIEYSKRYRDKKRVSNLKIAAIQPKYNSDGHMRPTQVLESHIHLQTYSAFQQNSPAHRQFEREFFENDFGHACDICDRLWFRKDLKYLQNNDATRNIELIRTLLSNAVQEIKICLTCSTAIHKQRIPPLAVYNGFKYPAFPDCLKDYPLDLVSERLISPRVPFKQIRRLRHVRDGQYGIFGQVINVPIEENTMVNHLPRRPDDDHTITVHIKRKKIHKSSQVYGIVTKRKLKMWLRYLKDTPLYKSYNVTVDDGFLDDGSCDGDDVIIFDEDGDNDVLEQIPSEESLMAQQQTLMWDDDMYSRIAAGEGNAAKTFDEHAEELSFPQIYLGQSREFRHAATPFMMATSELRRSDRRGVTPHHLLYMAMKIMRIRVKDSLHGAFKHSGQGIALTREQIQSDDYVHGSVETNLAFLRSIPNTPHYWAERKRDLFAMIRQYGKPTVFFTVSANEIGWPKLLQLLHKLKYYADISVEKAANMHFIEKSTLVSEDSVTCALYFNKLVEVLLKILQSKKYSPFKKYRLKHYFKRIEFRHRGSPDAHILAWLDNAPEDALNRDYDKAIDLIDYLMSVSAAEASGHVRLQTHKHNYTCYKGIASGQQKCRFDAPFMPVKKTMILTPLPDTENCYQQYKDRYNSIQNNLEQHEYDDFQSFYADNDIASDDEYVKIIRAGINRPRVFPKREPCQKWINPFNPFILNIVRSNTDFQFITEEYSCATYMVEYINKSDRGVSDLKRQMIEIIDQHPEFNLFEITKDISMNLLNGTEMTSQEAAWYLLREPLSKSSAAIVYIPTIRPVERRRVKKMRELSELADDTDVWKESWFDKYEKRPKDLADISLAQFVAKYYKGIKGEYGFREKPRVLRYRNYDKRSEYNEYRREMVTLHLPFRDEESDILIGSRYLRLYKENEALILDRKKEFESNYNIEKTMEICRQLCREHSECEYDVKREYSDDPS